MTAPSESRVEEGRTPRHLWDYWRIVAEGRRILAVTIGGTLAVAIAGTWLMPDMYRAEAVVEIDLRQASILGTESERSERLGFMDTDRQFKTEFVKIKSREILGQAMERERLKEAVPALARLKDPVAVLQRRVGVDMVPQTNAVRISVPWTDPESAAILTNALTKTYVGWDLEQRTSVLRERADRLRTSAEEKQGLRRQAVEHELAVIRSRPPVAELLALSAFAESTRLPELTTGLTEVERELESLRQTYGPNHELVQQKVAERSSLRRQLEDHIAGIEANVAGELRSLGGDPDKAVRHDSAVDAPRREAEEEFEDNLRKKLDEHLVRAELLEPKARIIESARPPKKPYSPSLPLNVALALVVGTGFGGGLVFFRDYLDSSVKTIDDVERAVGLNLLCVVPSGEEATRVRLEAFQTLRTGLLFSSRGRQDRVVLVTSAAPREGKSNITAGLARSLAASGESVIVLECDLRRPAVARLLGASGSKGLANYLADQSARDWRPFAQQVEDRLTVLPTGPVPPNPLDLIGQPRFGELVKQLKESFDWVLVDSPPVSSVSDGIVLASLSEMVLMVIRHDETDREVVRRARERLQAVGARVVGAILNGVDMSRSYNRDYYYGRYYYGHYYGDDATAARPGLLASFLRRGKA